VGIKKFKPTTNWRRWMSVNSFEEITTSSPYEPLTIKLKNSAGRSSSWRIAVRHQWGGHAKRYRLVDFYGVDKKWIEARVETIEYDPYRSAFIALVCYKDWERRYVLAHKNMKVWDKILTAEKAPLLDWNRMEIWNIPTWMFVYNLELIVWAWASSIRSAWNFGVVYSQEWEYAQVKMPSWEIRLVHKKCYATLGQVSNTDHNQIVIGKAGRSRWMWKRPTVLWKSMNPVDHPHWGWEWHAPIGLIYPKTPWWKVALWVKTRSRKKFTGKWILRNRKGKLLISE
jgi:large subunit ribosomal protein L2